MAWHAQEESVQTYLFAANGSLRRSSAVCHPFQVLLRSELTESYPVSAPSHRFPVSKMAWRYVFHIAVTLEYQHGVQYFVYRFSVGVTFRGVHLPGRLIPHFPIRFYDASSVTCGLRNATTYAT
ncbi:hypothetical protein MRX96_042191 [Rhipicephalus microplus]